MYNKISQRLIAFTAVIVILFSSINVSAAQTLSNDVMNELRAFSILRGDENGEFNLSDSVTRAEFTAMVVRMLDVEDYAFSGNVQFGDVSKDAWYYSNINTLVCLKIINGFEDGNFYPDNPVTLEEASKILVCALGYGSVAENRGGYPEGYTNTAIELRLYDDTDFSADYLTRADLSQMIYNCLDVNLMENDYSAAIQPSYKISDKTLRDVHLYADDDGAFVRGTGIVEANYDSYLNTPYSSIKEDEVVIDGNIVKVGNTDAADYLGMEIDYYAEADSVDGNYTLVFAAPTDKNNVVSFSDYEYDGVFGLRLRYEDENGKSESLELTDFTILIKNGRPISSPEESDYELTKGDVKAIDNDDDEQYDVLIINEFESVIVDEVKAENDVIMFKAITPYHGRTAFRLNDDSDIHYVLENSLGEEIQVSDIVPESVISIFADNDEQLFRFIVSDACIEGSFEQYSETDRKATVNGEIYNIENGASLEVDFSNEYKFMLNYRGEIAFIETVSAGNTYGYVTKTYLSEDMSQMNVRMLLPGLCKAEIKYDEEIEDDTGTKILKGGNSEVVDMPVADKVNVNGTRISGEKLGDYINGNQRIVRYTVNSEGEITKFDFPELIGRDVNNEVTKRTYNADEMVFGEVDDVIRAFGVSEDTQIICIPTNNIDDNTEFLAKIEINDEAEYTINGYDYFETKKNTVKLVVLSTMFSYDTLSQNQFGLVESVTTAIDEYDEIVKKAVIWVDGKKQEYILDDEVSLPNVSAGDAIQFNYGVNSEKITKIAVFASLGKNASFGNRSHVNITGIEQSRSYYGYPTDILYDELDDINARFVDSMTIYYNKELNGSCNEILINKRNTPPIYILKSGRNSALSIENGDFRDIYPVTAPVTDDNKVFVYKDGVGIRFVVVVKD